MAKNIVRRESLTEQSKSIHIHRSIKGILVPGDRMKELQIGSGFNTSQSAVRDAIRSLQALGSVEHRPHIRSLGKNLQ